MSTERPLHFDHLLQGLNKSLYTHFLMFSHVYSTGAGADNAKENLFHYSDFIHIFRLLYTFLYIAPGQGQTNHRGQNFYVNIKTLSF